MNRIARILAVMFGMALIVAACGSDDTDTDVATETEDVGSDAESEEAMEDEAMEEDDSEEAMEDEAMEDGSGLAGLEIVSIDFDAAEVVIANNGEADVNLDGHFLCNFPSYAAIADVGVVAAGSTVTVPIPVSISPAAGELGLYTSDSYSSPDAIQAYVEWGSADHERSSVAQAAGIWDGVPLTVDGNVLTVG